MLELLLSLRLEPLEDGGYLATCPDFPGFLAQGRTVAETLEISQDVARKLIEAYVEHDDPLPAKFHKAVRPHGQVRVPVMVPA